MDPKNFVYLSDHGDDEYINMLAVAAKGTITPTEEFVYGHSNAPIVLRSILKHKIIKQCLQDQRNFYYVDTGYLGNTYSTRNSRGLKYWHRIVRNNLQHSKLKQRPPDRLNRLLPGYQPGSRNTGNKIIVAAPDEKPCKYYGIDLEDWINTTVAELKKHTDREIVVRQRVKDKNQRMVQDSLAHALQDAHALVTYNSNSATEAVLKGVPAFVLAPVHAADPVTSKDLSLIENPYWPESDLVYSWMCHLAYCQFHVKELARGSVWSIINE
jgi:hypothetical protein